MLQRAILFLCIALGVQAEYGTPRNTSMPIRRKISWRRIAAGAFGFNNKTRSTKIFPGETLAYMTPWNSDGYGAAEQFAGKLTYAAPVWFQLRQGSDSTPLQQVAPNDVSHITVTGVHEVNASWVAALQSAGVLVTPRVVWEAGHLSQAQQFESVNQLATLVHQHTLNGLVLELPNIEVYVSWLSRLCSRLRSIETPAGPGRCIAVLRPPVTDEKGAIVAGTTAEHFESVGQVVDRISLMTYDFSVSYRRAGPNAPLVWMKHCVQVLTQASDKYKSKILLGLPFYGYDVGQPLVGRQFISLLKQHKPQLQWDKRGQEHSFAYREVSFVDEAGQTPTNIDHVVFFPTMLSQSLRLNASLQMGLAGVSIWEAGQGLPYFWDLL